MCLGITAALAGRSGLHFILADADPSTRFPVLLALLISVFSALMTFLNSILRARTPAHRRWCDYGCNPSLVRQFAQIRLPSILGKRPSRRLMSSRTWSAQFKRRLPIPNMPTARPETISRLAPLITTQRVRPATGASMTGRPPT